MLFNSLWGQRILKIILKIISSKATKVNVIVKVKVIVSVIVRKMHFFGIRFGK